MTIVKAGQNIFFDYNLKCKCILIGDGELLDTLQDYVKKNMLSSYVIFTGVVSNTYDFYNAFDLFVLPSLYEGLPVVGVEAQFNGLHLVTSTEVTTELNFSGNTHFLNLKDGVTKWSKFIFENINLFERKEVNDDKYSIEKQCDSLIKLYNKKLQE